MPPSNAEIAAKLDQLAELLRHQGVNRFKVKAYKAAADAVRSHPQRLSDVHSRGRPLPKIAGIGASISSAIREIIESGTLGSVERLSAGLPPGTAEIAEISKISIREAQRLIKAFHIQTPSDSASALPPAT